MKEFTGGLDTRRLPETTPGGVLLEAVNGHISRGGEFEKRAAFVKVYQLPVGTVGLGYNTKGLLVWGSGAAPVDMPSGVQYQRLQHADSTTEISTINSFDLFKGKTYVSATFEDGKIFHYYAGARVADWVNGRAGFKFNVTGGFSIAPGLSMTKFRITGGTNAIGNMISGVFIDGARITDLNILHTGDNATTAGLVAAEINRFVSDPNYIAVANGNEITVTATTAGVTVNGKLLTVTTTGNVTTNAPTNMAGGGVGGVSTINLKAGTYDLMDPVAWRTSNAETAKAIVAAINGFTSVRDFHAVWNGGVGVAIIADESGIWANGLAVVPTYTNGFTTSITGGSVLAGGADLVPATQYVAGEFVKTIGSKEYALSGSVMHFSMIADPTKWTDPATNTGAGFIDMSQEASGSEELMALAKYQNYVAVFSRTNIQIWYADPDPALNKSSQVLNNTGTRSPRSVCQFGDSDVYYLDESGIRSLRARDSSNSASTTDIGVLVDSLVIAKLQELTFGERLKVFGLIEPTDGRFWLTMGDLIFVFSYFSGAKVSAWSTYIPSVPGTNAAGGETDIPFHVDEAIVFRRRVYVRSGDAIYCYGGEDPTLVYDRTEASMQTPYLDANAPAKIKNYDGWDAAVRGTWAIEASMDPNNLAAVDKLGTIVETTYPHSRMPMQGASSHVSLTFRTRSSLAAKVGAGLIHYTMEGDEAK